MKTKNFFFLLNVFWCNYRRFVKYFNVVKKAIFAFYVYFLKDMFLQRYWIEYFYNKKNAKHWKILNIQRSFIKLYQIISHSKQTYIRNKWCKKFYKRLYINISSKLLFYIFFMHFIKIQRQISLHVIKEQKIQTKINSEIPL